MTPNDLKSSNHAKNVNSDNIMLILLFFDALIMINIDLIKKLNLYSSRVGFDLHKVLFDILKSKYIDNHHKEIASHILASDLSFVEAEVIDTTHLKNLMKWTYEFSVTKYMFI
jgi:hypothetical protein